jgi:tryptophan synthase alpha chain
MSNIINAFTDKKAFIGFITAGCPSIEKTKEFVFTMEKAGVDLIEIGIPFSDPVAEGEIIQMTNKIALEAGTTTQKVFDMIKEIRQKTDIPIVLLTYINPIFAFGSDKFFNNCKECEIDGVIIPDIPFEEKDEVSSCCQKYDIDLISLIAPTSKQRIKMIAEQAKGFIYIVSSMGVTGVRAEIKTNIKEIVDEIKKYTNTPVAVGFGISTPQQVEQMSSIADGVIVGSAICKIILGKKDNAAEHLLDYIKKMKQGIK